MANSRFHHEEIFRGKDLVQKLSKLKVTVCGAGALGSNLVDTLCRQGFSDLKVIDNDTVDVHNINTQVYGDMDVGALKVNALKNKVFRHVGTEIVAENKKLDAGTVKSLLKNSGLVVDCFDNTAARQCVQDECRRAKIPCLHAGLNTDYGEVFWDQKYKVPPDVAGDVCDYPLARNLIMVIVAITAEEIMDFVLSKKPRLGNWSLTLKDLAIKPVIV